MLPTIAKVKCWCLSSSQFFSHHRSENFQLVWRNATNKKVWPKLKKWLLLSYLFSRSLTSSESRSLSTSVAWYTALISCICKRNSSISSWLVPPGLKRPNFLVLLFSSWRYTGFKMEKNLRYYIKLRETEFKT